MVVTEADEENGHDSVKFSFQQEAIVMTDIDFLEILSSHSFLSLAFFLNTRIPGEYAEWDNTLVDTNPSA